MNTLRKKLKIDFELTELEKKLLDHIGIDYTLENDVFTFNDDYSASQIDMIYSHGARVGIDGLIDSCDLVDFYLANKDDLISYYFNLSDELGEGAIEMIQSFNYLKDFGFSKNDIFKAITTTDRDFLFDSDLYNVVICFVWGLAEDLAIRLFDCSETLENFEDEPEAKEA